MLNKAILVGRLTTDIELKNSSNGVEFCQFTIAVNRKTSEDKADFIDCVAFRNQAVNLVRYMGKGSLIGVEGKLQVDRYDAEDGTSRRSFRVVVDNVTFLESKKESAARQTELKKEASSSSTFEETDFSELEEDDDDLPY